MLGDADLVGFVAQPKLICIIPPTAPALSASTKKCGLIWAMSSKRLLQGLLFKIKWEGGGNEGRAGTEEKAQGLTERPVLLP